MWHRDGAQKCQAKEGIRDGAMYGLHQVRAKQLLGWCLHWQGLAKPCNVEGCHVPLLLPNTLASGFSDRFPWGPVVSRQDHKSQKSIQTHRQLGLHNDQCETSITRSNKKKENIPLRPHNHPWNYGASFSHHLCPQGVPSALVVINENPRVTEVSPFYQPAPLGAGGRLSCGRLQQPLEIDREDPRAWQGGSQERKITELLCMWQGRVIFFTVERKEHGRVKKGNSWEGREEKVGGNVALWHRVKPWWWRSLTLFKKRIFSSGVNPSSPPQNTSWVLLHMALHERLGGVGFGLNVPTGFASVLWRWEARGRGVTDNVRPRGRCRELWWVLNKL